LKPGPKFTVDAHPQRDKIIKAICAGKLSMRAIAANYDIPQTNVKRYLNDKLMEKAAAVIKAQDDKAGKTLIDELLERDRRVEKLFDACERYLRDTVNPEEYDLGPRAWEIDVQYQVETEGKPRYEKASLQSIIDRMNERGVVPIEFKYKHADPRKLLLEAANSLKGTMELRAKLAGKLIEGGVNVTVNQNFTTIKALILDATEGYPEVRNRIAEALGSVE